MNESNISQYYTQLHEFLRCEEHKIKRPLINEREETEKKVELLLEEIKFINFVKSSAASCRAGAGGEDVPSPGSMDSGQLLNDHHLCSKRKYDEMDSDDSIDYDDEGNIHMNIQSILDSIKSIQSVDQFINVNKNTLFKVGGGLMARRPIEFMSMMGKCLEIRAANEALKPPTPYEITLHDIKQTKNTLASLYELYHEYDSRSHSTAMIFTTGETGSYILDVAKNKWTKIEDDSTRRVQPLNSVVAAGSNVYVFGGVDLDTYGCLSLDDLKWQTPLPITTGEGGSGISTCFDGQKYIYLIGGSHNKNNLSRIDRFNVHSKKFRRVGDIGQGRVGSLSFFHKDQVYIVGGLRRQSDWRSILAFNTKTLKVSTFMEDVGFKDWIVGSCFDGTDLIYILDKAKNLFSISISTKHRKLLAVAPFQSDAICSVVFVQNTQSAECKGLLYFLFGSKIGNQYYNVGNDSWAKADDNDTVPCRIANGSARFMLSDSQQQQQQQQQITVTHLD
ncbi:hypothetical protein SAMD00019534_021270 [Acytostelium subglobosum LB1]|uniref:hypothetical protein n=1 Tax=Acytostelium subglobosum LB1 TaxID=1410327 RepID=UPI00064493FE|nr:hypothetical protein SAMD00019534_021270 [Acytostelium subglobosum LB1]GAM18952.1 hypothetical protein SAMD00019534_021270 [Acytostelium subglobosum LB1]|eukprot:XP_012758172.1 hypothetical protein SAMD00019534_021270 [Acytostelium subglobosum LB1]